LRFAFFAAAFFGLAAFLAFFLAANIIPPDLGNVEKVP
jgi:hypothetical protein